jgi:hypothetical protein
VLPPIYPTLASYNPFPVNSFRNMCSTPQKHPAATVAFCAPSGKEIEDSGFRERRVVVEKGRMRRLMKVGIVKAIIKTRKEL